jgi:hypothetical protein
MVQLTAMVPPTKPPYQTNPEPEKIRPMGSRSSACQSCSTAHNFEPPIPPTAAQNTIDEATSPGIPRRSISLPVSHPAIRKAMAIMVP